ncbi:MAG TPA: LLM class flavin-dependent oxidoreductase, partial [Anaerolineales bacterium]|nr:LLM class flavin-dependent oxidoreductase [Anaerolineales bacterium]
MSQPLNNQTRPFELGFYNFVDSGANPLTGEKKDPATVMKNMLEVIELADQVGLDVFAIGEHHRVEYLASAPEVILGAAAARTKNIRLSTAVTVLSSDDPVRVFQRFATVDLISNGRAEIMAGRGSFIESFPLFGYNLNDYDGLFDEKLRLLSKLNESTNITWSGNFRAPLNDLGIYPRPVQEKLPIWVAVGGTPESVVRAASMGLPMALAIIGGMPERFAPYLDLYRQASAEYGFEPDTIPL